MTALSARQRGNPGGSARRSKWLTIALFLLPALALYCVFVLFPIVQAAHYGALMEKLGASAEVPIVTRPFAEVAALAGTLGGAAKPSGAGGGDVGVAFLTSDGAAATFRRRAPHIGVEILSITTGARGLLQMLRGFGLDMHPWSPLRSVCRRNAVQSKTRSSR